MLDFIYHTKFEKEIAALRRQFCNIDEAIKIFQRLCDVQFNPSSSSKYYSAGETS